MTLAQIIPLVLQVSIGLIVFCVALQAGPGDLTYLIRRPSLMLRSLLAMNVVMPVLAALIAGVFNLRPELEVALILLAVAPVPPILPNKQGKAGGNVSYAIGLLMLSAVVAIVTVPLSLAIIGRLFGRSVQVPMALVANVVATSVIVPLIAGAIVRRLAPAVSERLAKPLSTLGTVLVGLAFIPVLIGMWPAIVARVGDFTLVAIVVFVLTGLAVGHLFGGPDGEDRTVLALSTAIRHPGVAMALAGVSAQDKEAVAGAVLLAVIVGSIVTMPYVKQRRRAAAEPAATA